MASLHSRSNSFPSQSHPIINDIQNKLERLKASKATSTSSICANLASLKDLYDDINNMIQMPTVQQTLVREQGQSWINELVNGSLKLVDLCSISRDIVVLTKESVQELESSVRRQADAVNAYVASRKKVNRMVNKCIKNLKNSNQTLSELPHIGKLLKEAESLNLSILKSVLILVSGQKETSSKKRWSMFLTKSNETDELCALKIHKSPKSMDRKTMLKELSESEMSIKEIEECLGAFFPSQSHPKVNNVEDHLERLKSSQAASTSSICANLASLKDLYVGINNMIQMPSIQHELACEQGQNWINELLEGSLKLVDLCGVSRDIVQLTKQSVQDLESCLRRNKIETATSDDVSDYVESRKKINKMINKCIKKNLKTSNKNTTLLSPIGTMLKEAESLDLSILKSVLIVLSGKRESSGEKRWSAMLSKMTSQTRRVYSHMKQESEAEDLCVLNINKSLKNMDSNILLKQLKASEMTIQEIEECLDSLFRCLVKTRVSLLNALSL
ncbi:hypothetical protein STAS_01776 [Striga asiatica]|uniref:Uncharacterized protein n=1 Tax=Striga asiatica TaxID=4170 RepID=A0A5A7P016_STRAF|nr:hypothetical protein STAS_01776 [Striga asiatica]